jgi:hypothetical protein
VAAGAKSSSIASGAIQPEHVIKIRNCSTLDYTVTADGQVTGNPPKLEYPNGTSKWTTSPVLILRGHTEFPAQSLIHKGLRGIEHLACTRIVEQSMFSSTQNTHSNLGIGVAVNVI